MIRNPARREARFSQRWIHRMTRTRDTLQLSASECVKRLGRAIGAGRISRDDWGYRFAASIVEQSKRPGWTSSAMQLATMRAFLAGLSTPDAIIDEADNAAA